MNTFHIMFFKAAATRHLKSYARAPNYLLPFCRISQSTRHSVKPVVAIKRETVNLWEQRSPLAPNQVKQLVQNGVRVLVQPSNRRCFSAAEFEAAGAIMQEDLHEANLILGVKRPTKLRSTDLLPEKTYAFFTHTIKAQPDNMEMLDTLLERKIRTIDYECMVNSANQRLVAFGKYAGFSGTIDILHGLGIRLLAMGHTTPFLQISMAHNYTNLQQAQQSVRLAGYEVARGRLPDSIGPLIIVVHGDGNVSQGSQMILDSLPVRYIHPEQLNEVARNGSKNCIYVCVANVSHYMEHVDGKPFVMSEYFEQPQKYRSNFIEKQQPAKSHKLFVARLKDKWDLHVQHAFLCFCPVETCKKTYRLFSTAIQLRHPSSDRESFKPFRRRTHG
ncbi:alpha-aminoadipic semialdehyde synthase, partial [Paragonimus westermani]